MTIDYKPLWHLLLYRSMSRTEIQLKAGISTRLLAKLVKNEDASIVTLRKRCAALGCELGDIMIISSGKQMQKPFQQILVDF